VLKCVIWALAVIEDRVVVRRSKPECPADDQNIEAVEAQ
jgi:hypothetical protein